jgi:hypothetical protein
MDELFNLKKKVEKYKEIVQNTRSYRDAWKTGLKDNIIQKLLECIEQTGMDAEIEVRADMENLEAVVLNLGDAKSGMYTQVNEDIKRHLIKHKGALIYQQLFNGKVIVLIQYPFIENYGQPRQPKTIAIYRPEEVRAPYIIRHLEQFITEITMWEDFDDDEPNNKIGFNLNFNNPVEEPAE